MIITSQNMDITILEKVGLTKNQTKIYVSLLKLGEATAQQIMKEAELHRSRVYDGLERLQEQGIVSSVIKDFKKYFQAVDPERLLGYLEEKKQTLKSIIPDLNNLKGMKKEEINSSIYKGKEGLKTIHSEILKQNEDIYVLGAKGLIFEELKYFMPNFENQRLKKKLKFICLWDNKESEKKAKNRKLIRGRVLPEGYSSKGVVNIFGDKVAIVLWKEKYPSGFIIDNREIADSFRTWFKLLWKLAKK